MNGMPETETDNQAQDALAALTAPGAYLPYPAFAHASGLKPGYVAELRRNGKLDEALVHDGGAERVLNIGLAYAYLADEFRYLASLGLNESVAERAEQAMREQVQAAWQLAHETRNIPRPVVAIECANGERRTIPLQFLHNAIIQLATTALSIERRLARLKRKPSNRRKR